MAADKWLEEELAELNEAELIIQQAMSDFLPVANGDASKGQSASSAKNKPEVTTSVPVHKPDHDVEKLTSQLISGFDNGKQKENYDSFNLPPPPDLDDFIIKAEEEKPASLPPPPAITNPPPVQEKKAPPPVMSKPAPPPVLPKPSRSTALAAKSKKNSAKVEEKKPDDGPASKPPPTAAGIPKNLEKNSMAELDFLTSNLLLNMENPKDEDFYGYCEKCGGVVEGEKVGCNALGGVYHIKCFTCVTCNMELHGKPFYAVEKTVYCENCYLASLERCTVCSEVISDRILRASGKPYHPECFKCCECGKSLDGIPFTVDDSDKIYCVDCYHQKFAPRCSVCKQPILPEPGKEETIRIVALDRSFHITCYKCEKCDIQLSSDKGCYPLDNHIYCLDCNTALVQQAA